MLVPHEYRAVKYLIEKYDWFIQSRINPDPGEDELQQQEEASERHSADSQVSDFASGAARHASRNRPADHGED